MAQKHRTSKVSNGGRKKANIAHEQKRQAKFAAKREAGNVYVYKANPFEKGTNDWNRERLARAEKAKSSKYPYAHLTSIFRKLDNELAAAAMQNKNRVRSAKKIKVEND